MGASLVRETLGLEALGTTREGLENLGTLGIHLGLEVLGKTGGGVWAWEPREKPGNAGSTPRFGKPGKCGYSGGAVLGLEILGKTKANRKNLGTLITFWPGGPGKPRKNLGASLGLENLESPINPRGLKV